MQEFYPIAVDLGILRFVTLSTREQVSSPRPYKQLERKLRRLQLSGKDQQSLKGESYSDSKQLLTPFQHKMLQESLEEDLSKQYRQRIEIMLLANEGKNQSYICQVLGCSQGTARYWIGMAKAGQAHKWHDSPIGRPKAVNEQYLQRLKELVTNSPRDYGYSFTRWTAQWLSKHLAKELGIETSDRNVNLLLKKMGLSTRFKTNTAKNTDPNSSRIKIANLSSANVSHSELDLFHSLTIS